VVPWKLILEDNLQMLQKRILLTSIIDVVHLGKLRIMHEYREMQYLLFVKVNTLLEIFKGTQKKIELNQVNSRIWLLFLPCMSQGNRESSCLNRFFFSCILQAALSFRFSCDWCCFSSCCFGFRFIARCPFAMQEFPCSRARISALLSRLSRNLRIFVECFQLELF